MPNIRIKDIPTTASATVNGDFFAVDSNASTRKLDAFNPTIGGILTVNGTGTSVFAGNANTALHVGAAAPYQRAAIGATRRLNYGDVLFSRNLQGQAGTDAYTTIGTDVGSGYAGFEAQYGGTARILVGTGSTTANAVVTPTVGLSVSTTAVATPLNTQIGGTPLIAPASIDRYLSVNVTALADNPALALSVSDGTKNARGSMYIDASTTQERMAWDFTYSSAQFPALEWRIAGNVHATLRNNGSLILSGTGTDSNNGRLQLATHTDISGGIGFGTDTSIWRNFANQLTTSAGTLIGNGGGIGYFSITTTGSAPLVLGANGVESLRIDGSTQNAIFSKDILLGTNGPSVPSTLSGRAPRQGLVFDGTAGTYAGATISALRTSPLTYEAVFRVPLAAGTGQGIMFVGNSPTTVGGNSGAVYIQSSGELRVIFRTDNSNYVIADLSSFVSNNAGEFVHFALVRPSSGNPSIYINGIAQSPVFSSSGSPVGGWQLDLMGTNAVFNTIDGSATAGTTILSPRIYNRALSAVEVRQLYENGAPAAEDLGIAGSIAPSNTTLTTSAVAQNFAYDTFSSTTNSFSAVETGGQACEANFISGTTFLGKAPRGARFLVSFTATLTSGATPSVRLSTQAVAGTSSAIVNVVNGSNSIILQLIEPFTAETGTGAGRVTFATGSNTNYSISNLVVTRLGAVLAPDATQTGIGRTWWDTSGNYANITLPTSGVRWNVPTSGNLYLSGTDGLTLDTNGSATLRYADNNVNKWWLYKLSGDINLYLRDMVNARMQAVFTPGASDITASSDFYSNLVTKGTFYVDSTTASIILGRTSGSALSYDIRPMQAGGAIRIRQDSASVDRYIALGGVDNSGAFTESMRIPNAGNVLIGTTTDSGAKLQVAGSGYFAGGISTKLATNNSGSNLFSILRADGTTSLLTATDANDGLTLKLGYTGLGNGSNWISLTGNGGGPGANITLNNGVVASFGGISYQVNGLTRWYVARSTAAETGSNAGSDFSIISYNDAGATIGTVFSITRSNSAIQCAGALTAFGPINASSLNTPNGTTVGPFTTSIGADATLGALSVSMGGSPSATAASRFGYIGAGDAGAWRRFIIGSNNATGGGQVLIPSTDISSSTSSGALVVSGGVGVTGAIFAGGNIQCNAVYASNNTTLFLRPQGATISAGQAQLSTTGDLTLSGTVVDPAITGTILEDIFTITDAAAFEVDPGNGSIQLITLGASRTPKATNFAAGESVTMMIDDGTAFTLTWTDATWGTGGVKWVGGSAPTLATTGYTVIQLWKVGTQVYGARVGDVV